MAYDEEQFEACRALGEHIVEDTFRQELVGVSPQTHIGCWLPAIERTLTR
jgi:hypothetical protein